MKHVPAHGHAYQSSESTGSNAVQQALFPSRLFFGLFQVFSWYIIIKSLWYPKIVPSRTKNIQKQPKNDTLPIIQIHFPPNSLHSGFLHDELFSEGALRWSCEDCISDLSGLSYSFLRLFLIYKTPAVDKGELVIWIRLALRWRLRMDIAGSWETPNSPGQVLSFACANSRSANLHSSSPENAGRTKAFNSKPPDQSHGFWDGQGSVNCNSWFKKVSLRLEEKGY